MTVIASASPKARLIVVDVVGATASGPLPTTGISVGPKTELDDDDRLYVGAWSRVVVRAATPDEVDTYA